LSLLGLIRKHMCKPLYVLDCVDIYKCNNIHIIVLKSPSYTRVLVIDGALLFNKPLPLASIDRKEQELVDLLDTVISARKIDVKVVRA